MPELPDITVYVEALNERLSGAVLHGIRIRNPFVLRTVTPRIEDCAQRKVLGAGRLGKRVVIALEGDLHLVVHLMIAGRLHWKPAGAKLAGKAQLVALDFSSGTLTLTEAGTKRRASLHLVGDRAGLAQMNRGGIEPLEATLEQFRRALEKENHTLKRALTDPRWIAGIGNAYSDEILHAAQLSPTIWTSRLDDEQWLRLFQATQATLNSWIERLRAKASGKFPERVTAFHPEMAVHGRFGQPCPKCGSKVHRIVSAERESNYCPRCQTGGRLLADRALSKLLKADWPAMAEEEGP